MMTVGTYEAKTKLAHLLERVANGETVTITRHGKPVAQLVPMNGNARSRPSGPEIIEAFHRLRAKVKRGGPSIRALIDEGRRT